MKKFIESKLFLAVVAIGLSALALTGIAATTVGVNGSAGNPTTVVLSTSGMTNSTSLATNGLYTAGLAASTTETNLLIVNPGGQADGDIIIQFTAAATASSTTNVTFVLSDSVIPVTITNNPAIGLNQAALTRGTFTTVTMALNGTTPVTTNIVYSKFSTPAIANGLNIYLESIQMGAGTAALTNYSVVSVP
jgi:hypothetical protein